MANRDELMPCPHCGNDVNDDEGCFPAGGNRGWRVQCGNPSCTANVIHDSRDEAVRAWNRRAPLHGAVPEGWQLVPRVADVNMVNAARAAGAVFGFGHHYEKALAAAPAPEADQHADCCDTPAYCSSVRRCTAKDAAPEAERAEGEAVCADCGWSGKWPDSDSGRRGACPVCAEGALVEPSPAPPPAGQPEGVDDYERIYAEVIKVCADQPMAHEIARRLASAHRAAGSAQ